MLLNSGTGLFPVVTGQPHEVIQVLALEYLLADSGQKVATEEPVVLHLLEVDDPATDSGGSELIVRRLLASCNTEGDVLERELRLLGTREEASKIFCLHRVSQKDMMNNKNKENHQL